MFRWEAEQPRLALALGGKEAVLMPRTSMQHDWPENCLFPALVAQLVAVIAASQPVAACSRCGRIHPRARRPRVDRPAYCTACRPEAVRANKRTSAAKARARNRLEP